MNSTFAINLSSAILNALIFAIYNSYINLAFSVVSSCICINIYIYIKRRK